MKRVLAGLMSAFAIATFATATVEAQTASCPPEVAKAKEQLSMRTAKADGVKAPRSLAGARQIESPRGQDIQSPRGQDIQSPRGQDIQSPRGQDIQSPRGQDIQSPRSLAGARQIESPRGQDIQSPRGQDIQSPRGQPVQSPRALARQKPGGHNALSLRSDAAAAPPRADMQTAQAQAE